MGTLLGQRFDAAELLALEAMDEPRNMPRLAELAAQAAVLQLQPQHLPAVFDPPPH